MISLYTTGTSTCRALLIFSIVALLGCDNTPATPSARFTQVALDGADLAALLQMPCAKYRYEGPDKWCHWQMSIVHYGPADERIDAKVIGGGGVLLRNRSSFTCLVPVLEGGIAATRFFGMATQEMIDPILPKRQRSSSTGWNSNIKFEQDTPLILAVFAVDTHTTLSFPHREIPRGHGGHVAVLQLRLHESKPEEEFSWAD